MSGIQGSARLGSAPALRYVEIRGNKKPVCEFSARLLNYKKNASDGASNGSDDQASSDGEQYTDRGFWVKVSVWGKFAEAVSSQLACGDRVYIADGNLTQDSFEDKDNKDEVVEILHVDCQLIFPWLPDLTSLKFKERQGKNK